MKCDCFWCKTQTMSSLSLEPRVCVGSVRDYVAVRTWTTVTTSWDKHAANMRMRKTCARTVYCLHPRSLPSIARFPRVPVPRWPQVAAWLPSWWRRWRRTCCGRRIVSPSCRSIKSMCMFFKAFKLLIEPLSDLSLWRDRFVSTSSDRCISWYSPLHVCFAC